MTLELKLANMGYECWLDQNAASITKAAMREGVESSRVFLLFLSEGVLTRPFCLFEIETALGLKKRIMLMHETDARHGAFNFDEADHGPAAVAGLLVTHESLPWRRRRFEQDAILHELIKNSGLLESAAPTVDSGSSLGGRAATAVGKSGRGKTGLAPIPSSVPLLPESFSPRPTEQGQIIDVLLGRKPEAAAKTKVSAHGMGGLGKTTLAAAVSRDGSIRQHFDRVGFVSVGQAPATLSLQHDLHSMLAGTAMEANPGATVASQRENLQQAAQKKVWLVVLDDLWTAEHERQLNFVDEEESPGCRVFVTTRFCKLFSGYVEVALGLLGEAAAIELLFGAAEVVEPTAAQSTAAKKLVKLAGFLPLYIGLVGRLVYEFGTDEPWQTEVVAMLEEDRGSVLAGDTGHSLGSRVVGSSLKQVQDPDAVDMFKMLAVGAEDVPIPPTALELIWCAHRELEPPLSRLQRMKLRRHAFALLDRNLIIGETTAGIFQHDVVREYSRALVGPDALRTNQRRVVAMLLAATPRPEGWEPLDVTDKLNCYVVQSLRHSMREAAEADPREGLTWLELDTIPYLALDFATIEAASAIGAETLRQAAREAGEGGEMLTAAKLSSLADVAWATSGTPELGAIFDSIYSTMDMWIAASSSVHQLNEEAARAARAAELSLNMAILMGTGAGLTIVHNPRARNLLKRALTLCEQGVAEPVTSSQLALLAGMLNWFMLLLVGSTGQSFGEHLNHSSQQSLAQVTVDALRYGLRSASMYSVHNPRYFISFGKAFGFNAAILPVLYFFPTLVVERHSFATPECMRLIVGYSFVDHSPVVAAAFGGMDLSVALAVDQYFALNCDLKAAAAWVDSLTNAFCNHAPPGSDLFRVLIVGLIYIPMTRGSTIPRLAGLAPAGAALVKQTGWSEADYLSTWEQFGTIMRKLTARSEDGQYSYCGDGVWLEVCRVHNFLLSPEHFDAEEFAQWLPGVGCVGHPRTEVGARQAFNVNTATHYVGNMLDGEAEVRERLGQYGDAIRAGDFWIEQLPFQVPLHCVCWLAISRSHLGAGREDRASSGFVRAINHARDHHMPLLELMGRRDYVVRCAPEGQARQLALIGRVFTEQQAYHCGDLSYLTAALGGGLDASGAIAAFEKMAGRDELPAVLPAPAVAAATASASAAEAGVPAPARATIGKTAP